MRITRIIASTLIITTAGLVSGLSDARAQEGSGATPPAEYPPISYTGKQYVDSRGCIYVRAEIDGAVTWVPRVARDRSQICGYKPTAVAGTTKIPPVAPVVTPEPESMQPAKTATAEPAEQPASTAAASSVQPASAPATAQPEQEAVVEAKPEPAVSPEAETVKEAAAEPKPEPSAPQTTAKTPEPEPQPTATASASAAASKPAEPKPVKTASKPRPKPATAPEKTVTVVPLAGGKAQPEIQLLQKTRVVPRHVYENRQHVRSVRIPRGYRPVWDDDRLNPHRAEMTLTPSNVTGAVAIPRGYQIVDREDDRFNSRRGPRTAEGNAQTMLIWTNEVPMRLIRVPTGSPVIRVDGAAVTSAAEAKFEGTFRVSTQSAPKPSAPKTKVMYDR